MAAVLHLHDRMSLAARRKIGHNLTDASALALVWNNGPIPIRLFARTIRISHPAAVQQIDRLCADGLLKRSVGKDRRYRLICLTRKGRDRIRAFLKARAVIARKAMARFSHSDRVMLDKLICRILTTSAINRLAVDHLCRCCDERTCPPQLCPAEISVARTPSPLNVAKLGLMLRDS